jgi:sulfur-carrier protein
MLHKFNKLCHKYLLINYYNNVTNLNSKIIMIKIELRLFADLRTFQPEDSLNYQIKKGTNIKELLEKLGINTERAKIIFINGKKKNINDSLKHRDRVGIFPPVGGG